MILGLVSLLLFLFSKDKIFSLIKISELNQYFLWKITNTFAQIFDQQKNAVINIDTF